MITENGKWYFQIFNFLDFGERIHSEETDEDFKKPYTTTSKFVKHPVMMNVGEQKM